MKVVIFCGGQGLRLRDYSQNTPKPMVPVGARPILWHLMKYYAHYGHTDFILALGYQGDAIKQCFLEYNEAISNDFKLSKDGVKLMGSDISNWNITFCDTGMSSNIGQRLLRVKEHLGDDEMFLANYADNLTDVPLDMLVEKAKAHGKVAQFVAVKPSQSFHVVRVGEGDLVREITTAQVTDMWINGGYFVLRREIFDYLNEGEELVIEPFQRLIEKQQLVGHRHDGFWACMDTFKEKQILEDVFSKGNAPWCVWNNGSRPLPAGPGNPIHHMTKKLAG